jgi:hypothetical protein
MVDLIGCLLAAGLLVWAAVEIGGLGRSRGKTPRTAPQARTEAPRSPENLAFEEHQDWLARHGVKADRAREGQHTIWWDACDQAHEGVEYISDTLGTITREHAADPETGKYHWV